MTQQMFLNELQSKLRRRLPEERVQEIINDYREYFSDGLAEGRDENTLCEAFGTPAEIVSELRSEGLGGYERKNFWNLIVWGSFLLLAYLVSFPTSWSTPEMSYFLQYGILFLPFLQMMVFRSCQTQSRKQFGKKRITVVTGCTVVPLLLLTALIHVLLRIAGGESGWLPFGPASLGVTTSRLLEFGMLIVLTAWGLSFAWGGRRILWLVLLHAGLFSTMQGIKEMLLWLSEPEEIAWMILESCIPLWASVVLSATLGLFFFNKEKTVLAGVDGSRRQVILKWIGWGSFLPFVFRLCFPLIFRRWRIPSVLYYGIPFLPLLQMSLIRKGRGDTARPLEKSGAFVLTGCTVLPVLILLVSSWVPLWFTREGVGWIPHGSAYILAPLISGLVVAGMLIALVGWELSFLWSGEKILWLALFLAGSFSALCQLSQFLYCLDDPGKMPGALLGCCKPFWLGIALAGYAFLRRKGRKDD